MDARETYRLQARRQHQRETQHIAAARRRLEAQPNRTDEQERKLRFVLAKERALPQRLETLLREAEGAYEFSVAAPP